MTGQAHNDTKERIADNIAGWRKQLARAAKSARFDMSSAEGIIAKYEAGLIDGGMATIDLYHLPKHLSLKSASVPLPDGYQPPAPSSEAPAQTPKAADPDDVSSIFQSAGYGHQTPENESAKVATILADHRQVTGSAPDRDQQVVDGIFASAGYPPKAATPSGNLTAAEQAHVDSILADHQAVTGIQRRSQSAEDRADADAVDKIFASAGYAPRAEGQDPKVREILSHHRAATGR